MEGKNYVQNTGNLIEQIFVRSTTQRINFITHESDRQFIVDHRSMRLKSSLKTHSHRSHRLLCPPAITKEGRQSCYFQLGGHPAQPPPNHCLRLSLITSTLFLYCYYPSKSPSSNHFSNALLSRSNVPSRGAIAKMKIDLRYTSNAQQNNFFALALKIIFWGAGQRNLRPTRLKCCSNWGEWKPRKLRALSLPQLS